MVKVTVDVPRHTRARTQSGADLEGGVGRPNLGIWRTEVPQWGPGAQPGRGFGGRSTPEAGAF